jgi:hypothetical protein
MKERRVQPLGACGTHMERPIVPGRCMRKGCCCGRHPKQDKSWPSYEFLNRSCPGRPYRMGDNFDHRQRCCRVFVVLIGLQCLYLALWVKVFVWGWLVFWISGRRKMSAQMENFLVQNRFPRPPKFVDDTRPIAAVNNRTNPESGNFEIRPKRLFSRPTCVRVVVTRHIR